MSRSGYYRWLQRADEPDRDYADYRLVKELFDKGRGKYGWRTIKMKLESTKNVLMNHKKISRLMKKFHLVAKIRRLNPYKAILKKTPEHRTFENALNRDFAQTTPRKVFVTDITYLPFNRRMAYLSTIKDVATREIVGWDASLRLELDIVFNTIARMKDNIPPAVLKKALIHSDHGGHYTNPRYIAAIKQLHMVQSMSRKGNCIDNAPMESFFGHFKDDVDYKTYQTFAELKAAIAAYIEYYNNERQQWNLKKMTPAQYRNHLLATPK